MLFTNSKKNIFFAALICASMFVSLAQAVGFALCRLEVKVAPEATVTSPEAEGILGLTYLYACPGGEIKLTSCVTHACREVKYAWFRASVLGDAPESVTINEAGKPGGIFDWKLVGTEPTLHDTLPVECRPCDATADVKSVNLLPTFVYVLVIEDECTGCYAISNPILVGILPCADLKIETCRVKDAKTQVKEDVSHDDETATFQITVTNNGPCTATPSSVLVQDCLPCGLKLLNVSADPKDWKVRIINCSDDQGIQALYQPALPAPTVTKETKAPGEDDNNTTSPILVTVKCHKDPKTNTAVVFSINPDQFDFNLGNNAATSKIKCEKHK